MRRLLYLLSGVAIVAALLLGTSFSQAKNCHATHTCPPPTPTATATATPSPTPSPTASGSVPPTACSGYPEPRIFMESMGRWQTSPGGTGKDYEYLIMGTCFPISQPVSGTVHFDIVVSLVDNPGTITVISPKIATSAGQVQLTEYPLNLACGTHECSWTISVSIDSTRSPYDGFEELRLFTEVLEPNGHDLAVSDGWLLDIANGKPHNDMWTNGREEGRGWYTHTCYANALLNQAPPLTPLPHSGTFTVHWNANHGGTGADCSPQPVTSRDLWLDADPDHAGVLVQSASGGGDSTATIDLSTLTSGPHHLVLMTHTFDSFFGGNILTGSEVIPFTVQ